MCKLLLINLKSCQRIGNLILSISLIMLAKPAFSQSTLFLNEENFKSENVTNTETNFNFLERNNDQFIFDTKERLNHDFQDLKISQIDTVFVQDIILENNTIFSEEDLKEIIEPLKGKEVTFEELDSAANEITNLYLNRGYILSRAFLEPDFYNDGIVKITVIEGFLEDINISGADRLENYIRQRIELGAGKPLNYRKLEDKLRLLKEDLLIENIEAKLTEGSALGQNILEVKVTEAEPFIGSVGFDNYSVPSIGDVRFNLNLGYQNITGLGDSFFVSYNPRLESWDGTYTLDLNYEIPINPMDGKLRLRTLIERNRVVNGAFEDLDISGESEFYEISYRQPLIRELNEEFALSFGISYREGQTFTFAGATPFGFGPDEDGNSRTNVLTLGQEYSLREPNGAWAFRSQFRVGMGIFDVTENPHPIPDGYFFAWLGQIQRLQVIDENNLLIMQLDAQLTPDSLLPSEQFTIGGAQSVRGYRQNALTADNGIRFSIEDRITLMRNEEGNPYLQIAPFMDMGGVWNVSSNPNSLIENQTFIIGLGLGVLWQPVDKMQIRLDYAPPIINLDTKGDNVQDDGFYFSINYRF